MAPLRVAPGAKRVVLIVLFWTLAACRPGPATTPTDRGGAPSPTIFLTATPAPSKTITLSPSPTKPKPTKTPTATGTPTNTLAPPTDDPYLAVTQAVESLMAHGSPQVIQTSNSPNGGWRIVVARYNCRPVDEEGEKAYELLELVDVATGEETTVDAQLQNCGGVGAFGLGFRFWSEDGQSLYYTTAREGTPDGLCGYWEPPLIQYHMQTHARTAISQGPLSPAGGRLAFSGGSWGSGLTIWDLNDGKVGQVPVKVRDGLIQGIAWAPDGKALAYLQVDEVCGPPGQSTIVIVDVDSFQQTVLFTVDSPGFRELSWKRPNEISLVDENGEPWSLTLSPLALLPN